MAGKKKRAGRFATSPMRPLELGGEKRNGSQEGEKRNGSQEGEKRNGSHAGEKRNGSQEPRNGSARKRANQGARSPTAAEVPACAALGAIGTMLSQLAWSSANIVREVVPKTPNGP